MLHTVALVYSLMTQQLVLSAVTDAYGKGPDHADRMRGCAKVIRLMLRTWSGESKIRGLGVSTKCYIQDSCISAWMTCVRFVL